jgi:hypothetical protein
MKSSGETFLPTVQESAGPDPQVGDEFTEHAVNQQRPRNRVMLTRPKLTTDPGVH